MELNETGFSDDGSCDRDEQLVPLLLAGIPSLAGLASELGHVTKDISTVKRRTHTSLDPPPIPTSHFKIQPLQVR
jgi:hypothetical protein